MYYWGDRKLIVRRGSYEAPYSSLSVHEISVIPKPGETSPSSVIQTGGRSRGRARFTVFLRSAAEYNSLYADYMNSTIRTFSDRDGLTMDCFIAALSVPRIYSDVYRECSVELLEV